MNECQWAHEVHMVQMIKNKRQEVIRKSLKEVYIVRLSVVPQHRKSLVTVTDKVLPPAVKLLCSKVLSAFRGSHNRNIWSTSNRSDIPISPMSWKWGSHENPTRLPGEQCYTWSMVSGK